MAELSEAEQAWVNEQLQNEIDGLDDDFDGFDDDNDDDDDVGVSSKDRQEIDAVLRREMNHFLRSTGQVADDPQPPADSLPAQLEERRSHPESDGKFYTYAEFQQWYRQNADKKWSEAYVERRLDGEEAYTAAEFVEYYGAEAERAWGLAQPAHPGYGGQQTAQYSSQAGGYSEGPKFGHKTYVPPK